MVAVIKTSDSLRNSLNYNEQKLQKKVAALIHSAGYAKDTEMLSFTDKIRTLENLAERNEHTRLNSVHISLNFDPSEQLDKEILQQIADAYMQRIGFGKQPYLVYQHHDAGHPHLHIVSTNIQRDGRRIKMQNIGRNQSEKARKEIEKEFKLVQAESHHLQQAYELRPVKVQKVQYGKSDTRRAIINVLDVILATYKFTTLPELNAVLHQYNIVADRGNKGSRTYSHNGLLYRILDDKGQKIGIPIKASAIYNKPTLKFLQERFKENEPFKQRHKPRVKNAIDFTFMKNSKQSLDELITSLQKEKIQVVLRQNEKGFIYGLTYIDHHNKCIFNGSDLGKAYSATAILQKCNLQPILEPHHTPTEDQKLLHPIHLKKERIEQATVIHPDEGLVELSFPAMPLLKNIAENLIQAEPGTTLAAELSTDQNRKKKRKKLHQ